MATTQGVALKKISYLNSFKKCPHCEERGGVYYAHKGLEDNLGWSLWCYFCGFKS